MFGGASTRRICLARLLLAGLFACLATASFAQSIAELAGKNDPGRRQRLIEGAKREGTLTFYTSIPEKDMSVLAADFEKRYGVKVNVWRASTVKVVQRLMAEKQANRWDFDAVDISGPEMEILYGEKLLQEVDSDLHRELLPETLMPHRGWAPQFLSVFVQAYNTNALKRPDLPKSYEDLLQPRWKGMLGVEANDHDWYCGLLKHMGPERGARLFSDLVEKNGWSVRQGHTLLTNMVASGEVPLGLTVYSYMVDQARARGAPIDWFAIEPLIGRSNGIGVSRRPPHPHAALLFYEYMIGEAQPQMVRMNYLSPVKKLASEMKGAKVQFIDPAAPRPEVEKCEADFNRLLKGGR
jgi:iron(III) transport system substrate-binding protein